MQWGQHTTHTMPSSAEYDRSYGKGQPVRTLVYLNIAGNNQEVFNSLIPQDTTILDIILNIDRNSHSSSILASDEYSQYTGDYQLNNGYSLTDMNGNCLDVTLDTPVENIVTLGQQRQRQAIFIIVYSVNRWCNMMGGRKSYKKYKKTYRKSKKSKKSRRHRRK